MGAGHAALPDAAGAGGKRMTLLFQASGVRSQINSISNRYRNWTIKKGDCAPKVCRIFARYSAVAGSIAERKGFVADPNFIGKWTLIMSERNCPNCGAALPLVDDAFCPICRNDLSESKTSGQMAPEERKARFDLPSFRDAHATANGIVVWFILIGAAVQLIRENPRHSLAIGVTVAFIVVAEVCRRTIRSKRRTTNRRDDN
jgi:hypothetical protein